jgi:hypothetical protein
MLKQVEEDLHLRGSATCAEVKYIKGGPSLE